MNHTGCVETDVVLIASSFFIKVDDNIIGEVNLAFNGEGWSALTFNEEEPIVLTDDDYDIIYFEDINDAIGAVVEYAQ